VNKYESSDSLLVFGYNLFRQANTVNLLNITKANINLFINVLRPAI